MNLRRRIVYLFSQIDIIERIYPAVLCGIVRKRKRGVGNLLDICGIVGSPHIIDTLSKIVKSLGRPVGIDLVGADDRSAGQRSILVKGVQDLRSVGVIKIAVRDSRLDRCIVDLDVVLNGIRSGRCFEVGDLINRELIAGLRALDRKSDLLGGRQSSVCSGYIGNGDRNHHDDRE